MILDKSVSTTFSSTRMTNVCMRNKIGTYKDLLIAQMWKLKRLSGFGKELVSEVEDLREAVFPQLCREADKYSTGRNYAIKREAYIDGVLTERNRIINSLADIGLSLSEEQTKTLWNIK